MRNPLFYVSGKRPIHWAVRRFAFRGLFFKEVNPQLAKCPLKTNRCLANRGLTSLVKILVARRFGFRVTLTGASSCRSSTTEATGNLPGDSNKKKSRFAMCVSKTNKFSKDECSLFITDTKRNYSFVELFQLHTHPCIIWNAYFPFYNIHVCMDQIFKSVLRMKIRAFCIVWCFEFVMYWPVCCIA